MSKGIIVIVALLFSIIATSCEDDAPNANPIIGKWKHVKINEPMSGIHLIPTNEQSIVEYRKDKTRILYDYSGVETARTNYDIIDSKIIISGRNLNGELWNNEARYWLKEDTLVVRADGGFEYYDDYWIRIK